MVHDGRARKLPVEVGPSGTPTFFAGQALSVELCSVSGCFPHIVDYPAPPRGGLAFTLARKDSAGGHRNFPDETIPRCESPGWFPG